MSYKGHTMYRLLFLPLIIFLVSCDSENHIENESRDLNNAVSFSELIEKRMQVDNSLDGEIVLVTSELSSKFFLDVGIIDPAPERECTDDIYITELTEPSYNGSGVELYGVGITLRDQYFSEKLHINSYEDSVFYSLGEDDNVYRVPVNFYAKVEYVERQVWCSDQINYGIKFTLLDGEDVHLLEQLR